MTTDPAEPDGLGQQRLDVLDVAARGTIGDLPAPALGSGIRNSVVFAAAAALQRGLIFLLLPVYTRALAPAEYGRLSVLLAIAAAAILVFSCGMDTAFFRTYFALRSDPDGQRRFVTTAWVFLLVVPPAAAALVALAAAPLLDGNEVIPPGDLALGLAGAALFVSATVVPLALLRAEERLRDYMILSSFTALTTAALTLVAVVALDGGVAGWLVAVVVANAMTLVAAIRLIPLKLGPGVDRRMLGGALALGLPLIPHVISHWGLGISNRLVLAGLVSTSKVGIYALAANVALPVAILMQSMGQGFMPSFARAATDPAELPGLQRVVTMQFLIVVAMSALGALIGPIAVHFLAPPEYAAAARLVPLMALGYGFLGLYFIPMNAVALTAGRTGKVWLVTVVAACSNLLCLFILVPVAGLTGAAVAVPVGYFVLLVGVMLYSRGADNPVRYDTGRLARGLLAFAVIYLVAIAISGDRTAVDACIRFACLLAVLPLLVGARVIDSSQLAMGLRRLLGLLRPARSARVR